jgi:hypothetical protein
MKKRLQNWITTTIGAVLMALAVVMYVIDKFYGFEIPVMETVTVAILGWVFITARDTLLEGLFLNIFKIKKPDIEE